MFLLKTSSKWKNWYKWVRTSLSYCGQPSLVSYISRIDFCKCNLRYLIDKWSHENKVQQPKFDVNPISKETWKTFYNFCTNIHTQNYLVRINCNKCQIQLSKFIKNTHLLEIICFQLYEVLLSCLWNTFNVKMGPITLTAFYIIFAGLWGRRCVCDTI